MLYYLFAVMLSLITHPELEFKQQISKIINCFKLVHDSIEKEINPFFFLALDILVITVYLILLFEELNAL